MDPAPSSGLLLDRLREAVRKALETYEEEPPEALAPVEEGEEPPEGVIESGLCTKEGLEGTSAWEECGGLAGQLGPAGEVGFAGTRVPVHEVEAVPPAGLVAGVDGSSRSLSGGGFAVGVVSAAVAAGGLVLVFPGLSRHAEPPTAGEAGLRPLALAVPTSAGVEEALGQIAALRPIVYMEREACEAIGDARLRRDCARLTLYWGYQRQTMVDENRILAETAALRDAISLGADLVLLDGPVYSTPGLFQRLARLKKEGSGGLWGVGGRNLYALAYAASYAANVGARALLLQSGAAAGRVVGVVKRLANSKMLLHAATSSKQAESPYPSDEALLRALVPRALRSLKRAPRGALAFGPVLVKIHLDTVTDRIEEVAGELLGVSRDAYKSPCKALAAFMEGGEASRLPRIRDDYASLLRMIAGDAGRIRDIELTLNRGDFCVIGDLARRLNGTLRKLVLYLAIPRRPDWAGGYVLLRLEAPVPPPRDGDVGKATREAWATLTKAAGVVVYETVRGAGGVPRPIEAADRAAGAVVRGLSAAIYNGLSDVVKFWDYETLKSMEEVAASA